MFRTSKVAAPEILDNQTIRSIREHLLNTGKIGSLNLKQKRVDFNGE